MRGVPNPGSQESAAVRFLCSLGAAGFRLRLQRAARLAGLFLAAAFLAAAVAALAGTATHAAAFPWSDAAAGGAAALLFAAASLLLPGPSRSTVAVLLDRRLRTGERCSAALARLGSSTLGAFDGAILGEAAERAADFRTAFPWGALRRTPLLPATAATLLLLVPMIPTMGAGAGPDTPQAGSARRSRDERSLRAAARELAALPARDPADRPGPRTPFDSVLRDVGKLAEAMERGRIERVAALSSLQKLEASLARAAAAPPPLRAGSETAAAVLHLEADPSTAALAEAMRAADRERLANAFRELERSLRSEDAASRESARRGARGLEALAEALAAEARRLRETEADDPDALAKAVRLEELANALRETAAAMREGDLERARSLLAAIRLEAADAVARSCGARPDLEAQARRALALAKIRLGLLAPPRLPPSGTARSPGSGAGPDFGVGSTNDHSPGFPIGEARAFDRQGDAEVERIGRYEERHPSRLLGVRPEDEVRVVVPGREGDGPTQSWPERGLGVAGAPRTGDAGPPTATPGGLGREEVVDAESVPPAYRAMVREYFEKP